MLLHLKLTRLLNLSKKVTVQKCPNCFFMHAFCILKYMVGRVFQSNAQVLSDLSSNTELCLDIFRIWLIPHDLLVIEFSS